MKLVDILARELKVWPDNAEAVFYGDAGRLAYFDLGTGFRDCLNVHPDAASEIEPGVYRITRAQWEAAVDALKAENCAHLWVGWSDTEACELCKITRKIYAAWDGDGSPPIGALVQDHSDIGGPVYMAEVVSVEDKLVAIKRHGSLKVVDARALRPVRTPEQIAADERSAAIEKMILVDEKGSLSRTHFCGLLYDAGYRKSSTTDN